MFTRETPTWLPHASANQPGSQPVLERRVATKKVEDGAERIQTISDSQKRFAAQFSHPTVSSVGSATTNMRIPGGSRWASKPERLKAHSGGSPLGSRWPVSSQARDNTRMPLSQDLPGTADKDVRAPLQYGTSISDETEAARYRQERNERGGTAGGSSGGSVGGSSEGGAGGGHDRDDGAQRAAKSSSGSKSGVGHAGPMIGCGSLNFGSSASLVL